MTNPNSKSTIVIVDDHPLIREGLVLRLSMQPDLIISGEAATEEEGFLVVKENNPDLVLLDIKLQSGNGIDLLKRLKAHDAHIKVLIFSGFQDLLYVERALRNGALGYLSKQESNENVLNAIRTVLSGSEYYSPAIAQLLIGRGHFAADPIRLIASLTDREQEIFRMIGEGMATGLIANNLFLSTHTIDTHRQNIKRKLQLKSAGELNRAAVQWAIERTQ